MPLERPVVAPPPLPSTIRNHHQILLTCQTLPSLKARASLPPPVTVNAPARDLDPLVLACPERKMKGCKPGRDAIVTVC
jgi:hypothetical protein